MEAWGLRQAKVCEAGGTIVCGNCNRWVHSRLSVPAGSNKFWPAGLAWTERDLDQRETPPTKVWRFGPNTRVGRRKRVPRRPQRASTKRTSTKRGIATACHATRVKQFERKMRGGSALASGTHAHRRASTRCQGFSLRANASPVHLFSEQYLVNNHAPVLQVFTKHCSLNIVH